MPLPTSVPETAADAFNRVLATASSVKSNLTGVANLLGPNPPSPVTMDNLIGLAQFMASIVACKAVTDWLLANMPSDGKGGFVGWQHQADGTVTRLTVDPTTLAPLSALIAAALATFA